MYIVYIFLIQALHKMLNNKDHAVGTAYQQTVETNANLIYLTRIYDRALSCLGTAISIKIGNHLISGYSTSIIIHKYE